MFHTFNEIKYGNLYSSICFSWKLFSRATLQQAIPKNRTKGQCKFISLNLLIHDFAEFSESSWILIAWKKHKKLSCSYQSFIEIQVFLEYSFILFFFKQRTFFINWTKDIKYHRIGHSDNSHTTVLKFCKQFSYFEVICKKNKGDCLPRKISTLKLN